MHLVPLLAPRLENENHMKDIDFSPAGIGMRREAGYKATMRALERAPWQGEFDPIEGIILHESMPDLASRRNEQEVLRREGPNRLRLNNSNSLRV
jgi:NTE family protein